MHCQGMLLYACSGGVAGLKNSLLLFCFPLRAWAKRDFFPLDDALDDGDFMGNKLMARGSARACPTNGGGGSLGLGGDRRRGGGDGCSNDLCTTRR